MSFRRSSVGSVTAATVFAALFVVDAAHAQAPPRPERPPASPPETDAPPPEPPAAESPPVEDDELPPSEEPIDAPPEPPPEPPLLPPPAPPPSPPDGTPGPAPGYGPPGGYGTPPPAGQPPYGRGPAGSGPGYGAPYGEAERAYDPPPPPPGYDPGYRPNRGGYPPPPRRPEEVSPPSDHLDWSLRYDPFDLLFRRITFEGEVSLGDLPLSVEVAPTYIFDAEQTELEERGFALAAAFGWYVQGRALDGFWVKANLQYERFQSTLFRGDTDNDILFGRPNPEFCDAESGTGTCRRTLQNLIVGATVGNTYVFGADGGFAISGGIGIGVGVLSTERLEVLPCTQDDVNAEDPNCAVAERDDATALVTTYNDGAGRIQLLGSLSLGVVF
ncbi:MAG: hypothetical protein AAF715_14390 [Myxococcota bacterium]